MKRLLAIVAILLIVVVENAYGACVHTSSSVWTATPDYASVSSCVSQAVRGDTVNVSSGTATWESALAITKAISLKGAGIGNTIISFKIENGNTQGIWLNPSNHALDADFLWEISGFEFRAIDTALLRSHHEEPSGSGTFVDYYWRNGAIRLNNSTTTPMKKVRIHHNKFYDFFGRSTDKTNTTMMHVGPWYGAADHNIFDGDTLIQTGTGVSPWTAWNTVTDFHIGNTANMFYYEDNYFLKRQIYWYFENMFQNGQAGFYSARYNTIEVQTNSYLESVDLDWDWYYIFDFHHQGAGSFGALGGDVYANHFIAKTKGGTLETMETRSGELVQAYNLTTFPSTNGSSTSRIFEEFYDDITLGPDLNTACPASFLYGAVNMCSPQQLDGTYLSAGHPRDTYFLMNKTRQGTGSQANITFSNQYCVPTATYPAACPDGALRSRENAEFWKDIGASCSGTSCTSGIGCGTQAQREAITTCTAGVGWFQTNESCSTINTDIIGADYSGNTKTGKLEAILYVCGAGNTWTKRWEPYQYPHPLVTDSPPYVDTQDPWIISKSPSGSQGCTDTPEGYSPISMVVTTNEPSDCVWCDTANENCVAGTGFTSAYMTAFTATGGLTHTQSLSKACNASYTYRVICRDKAIPTPNTMDANETLPFSVAAASSSEAPRMSLPLPQGIQTCTNGSGGTASVTLGLLAEDEEAVTCKYSTNPAHAYADMPGTFDVTGGTPTLELADSYPETNYNSYNILSDTTNYTGQSFTAKGGILDSTKVYLRKFGTPTGNAEVRIYAHSGTFGTSSVPTGDTLATVTLDVSTLSTSFSLITLNYTGANRITLTEGTNYVAVVYYNSGTSASGIHVGIDNTSPTHSGNAVTSSGGWPTALPSSDRIFYIYVLQGTGGQFSKALTLGCGANYHYYYLCSDGTNINTTPLEAIFSVPAPTASGVIEAESCTVAGGMIKEDDVTASGALNIGGNTVRATESGGTLTCSVPVGTAGTYRILANTFAASSGSDSMYLKIDSQDQITWHFNPAQETARWNVWNLDRVYKQLSGWTDNEEYHVTLTADTHSIVFTTREIGAKLDYFWLQQIENPVYLGQGRYTIGSGMTMKIGEGCTFILE